MCNIRLALDHLQIYFDNTSFGAISLVSKSHHQMIVEKFGTEKTEIFILEHYIQHPIYSKLSANIKSTHLNEIINHKISLNIIAKKKLRKIIGPELFFKSHTELFFESDLEYMGILHQNGICTKLMVPATVCVFCREIKSFKNMHSNCYDIYHMEHFPHVNRGKTVSFGIKTPNILDENFMEISNCMCNKSKKIMYCYLCPELIELVKINYEKYFGLKTVFDTKLSVCTKKHNCDCKYWKLDKHGEISYNSHDLNYGKHMTNWIIYTTLVYLKINPSLADVKHTCQSDDYVSNNECKSCYIDSICHKFIIPPTSIYHTISIHTPCFTCDKPKFLHGFYT